MAAGTTKTRRRMRSMERERAQGRGERAEWRKRPGGVDEGDLGKGEPEASPLSTSTPTSGCGWGALGMRTGSVEQEGGGSDRAGGVGRPARMGRGPREGQGLLSRFSLVFC